MLTETQVFFVILAIEHPNSIQTEKLDQFQLLTNKKKTISALSIGNTLLRKQVIEMLSAICVYNSLGYQSVLNALDYFKVCIHIYI